MINKYALITGASSGIGYEMAKILAAKNINLLLVSRNENKLKDLQKNLSSQYKIEVEYLPLDLSEINSALQLYEYTQGKNLEIDILINNAGVGLYGEHSEIDINDISKMLQLNIISLSELSHYYSAEMKKRKSGRILNIASTAAYQPTPYFAAYGASKSYVLNFSEAMAKELEEYNITVSCLSPGATDTNFFSAFDNSVANNTHLNQNSRVSVEAVAQIGIDIMFAGKLSKITGKMNAFKAFSTRFASRKQVVNISKKVMQSNN